MYFGCFFPLMDKTKRYGSKIARNLKMSLHKNTFELAVFHLILQSLRANETDKDALNLHNASVLTLSMARAPDSAANGLSLCLQLNTIMIVLLENHLK